MRPTLYVAVLLLQTVVPVAAQGLEEKSIPAPTQFSVAVSDAGAQPAVVGSPTLIKSDESTAEIAAMEVGSEDARRRGVRVLLRRAGQAEALYLDLREASQLRDELAELDTWYERSDPCDATRQCVFGVARCRPSQTVQQAFCPGLYWMAEGEQGALISTPRSSFRFPGVRPAKFVRAIETTIGNLKQQR